MKLYVTIFCSSNIARLNSLLFFLFAGAAAYCQSSGTLKGVVMDAQTRNAIIGANIFLQSEKVLAPLLMKAENSHC
ncbi:MAG: hypothetical protein IPG01_19535 [Chitinophagaceae bacterium]|nr:hypothetical protein [Chitinophagaceae bacterium]